MAIEIVDLPLEHGEFPVRYVNVYQVGYFHRPLPCWIPPWPMVVGTWAHHQCHSIWGSGGAAMVLQTASRFPLQSVAGWSNVEAILVGQKMSKRWQQDVKRCHVCWLKHHNIGGWDMLVDPFFLVKSPLFTGNCRSADSWRPLGFSAGSWTFTDAVCACALADATTQPWSPIFVGFCSKDESLVFWGNCLKKTKARDR